MEASKTPVENTRKQSRCVRTCAQSERRISRLIRLNSLRRNAHERDHKTSNGALPNNNNITAPCYHYMYNLIMTFSRVILFIGALSSVSSILALSPNPLQKALLKMNRAKGLREKVVDNYFRGVDEKDRDLICSCFADTVTIRDVCNLNASTETREANPQILADRCFDFLAAHPDTNVFFHYPPTCGRNSKWVYAHWYETGTWSGESLGVEPQNTPLNVEGQTRFLVNNDLRITDMVVTRTFSDWEKAIPKE